MKNIVNRFISSLPFRDGVGVALLSLAIGMLLYSCSDACEYKDTDTNNPSWVDEWNDTINVPHPDDLRGTTWKRQSGLKTNAYGQDVQGFVESLVFQADADSVAVTMSQGATAGTWTDESNTEANPFYECTYSNVTGKLQVLKRVVDDKGKVSKTAIFTGIAVISTRNSRQIMTICHYGDTPVQTYMVKQ